MILTIDAGNSRTKWGVFDGWHALIATGVFVNNGYPTAPPAIWATCHNAIVACVASEAVADDISRLVYMLGISARFIKSTATACGVKNNYDNPAQLGVDRWAAVIAAWQLTKAPCVVVNAGTAVTVDAVAIRQDSVNSHKQGVFMGGLILPGLQLMQTSLLGNTAQIQAGHAAMLQAFPTNTANAMHTGAVTAVLGLIKAMMSQLQVTHKDPVSCILSGGDTAVFAAALENYQPIKLANPLIVDPYLVLKGLLFLNDGTEDYQHSNHEN